jgi:hypothetical protein
MTAKSHKKSNWPKGVSDSGLQALWRKVVRDSGNNTCALQGYGPCGGALECHHIKRRNIPHLRYSPANGILLCQEHHKKAKLRLWRNRVEAHVGLTMDWLDLMEVKLFPDFLFEKGMTRKEWLASQKAYLTKLSEIYRKE